MGLGQAGEQSLQSLGHGVRLAVEYLALGGETLMEEGWVCGLWTHWPAC